MIDGDQSKDVQVRSTPLLASLTCDSHSPDLAYVRNTDIVFDGDEDYEDDEDNDPEQSDDVLSSSLVSESSPYLDAIIHNDVLYSVVRPRDQS